MHATRSVFLHPHSILEHTMPNLSIEAIQDIIDHAASLAIRFRNDADGLDLSDGLAEMSEALEVYDVIAAAPEETAEP